MIPIVPAPVGLGIGDPVNFSVDGTAAILTNSNENEYNGLWDGTGVVPVNTGRPVTWTGHGFTEPFLYLSTTGTWVTAAEGTNPVIGLQVIDQNRVLAVSIPG